jgi:hydroxypyruvate isomerase
VPTVKWSTSVSMMFREHALPQRLQAAREAGFEGVEIQILAEAPALQWVQAREAAGIEVALINVDMGDFLGNGAGLSGVPGREAAFRAAAEQTLSTAQALGCRHVHIGPSRVPEGVTRETCLRTLVANLMHVLPAAEAVGIRLLLEPLNRIESPTVLLGAVEEAASLLAGLPIAADRVGLQFDVYHVVMNGSDPVTALGLVRSQVAHVQFSDAPGRKPPGGGTIDFARFLKALKATGYDGWCGAEYLAPVGAAATLGWMPGFKSLVS